jgi:coenzyme F420-reducing hydrogenase gamma subunit
MESKIIKKKRLGIFSLTCDEGCSIYFIEILNKKLLEWLPKIKFHYFLSIKDKIEIKDIDIALIEGVVSSNKEKKELKEIRANSKILIAMGNCAISSQPSGQRNNFSIAGANRIAGEIKKFKLLPKCLSVKEVVKVDAEIPGCPINEEKLVEVLEKYINL